jgi:ATP-binding protein involved in chromosome partitioning
MTTNDIRARVETLVDEATGKTLKETGAIKHIGIDPEKNQVIMIVAIAKTGGEEEKNLLRQIAKIVKVEMGFRGLKVQFEETRKLEGISSNQKVKFIIVASGKGGVGKSTVACNLAYALARQNKKVGLIDADIYGSSVPRILEMKHRAPMAGDDQKIIPFKAFGIELISTEFFAGNGVPVIWRGALLNSMMNHFFHDVKWSRDLEYMIIDSPPGTGDIMLDLKNLAPTAQVLIVTTPHTSASEVATKAGIAFRKLKHDIIGVIENMSYYLNPANNEKDFIFGKGGGEKVAQTLGVELLAQIPINQPKHHLSLFETDEETGRIYDDLATFITLQA